MKKSAVLLFLVFQQLACFSLYAEAEPFLQLSGLSATAVFASDADIGKLSVPASGTLEKLSVDCLSSAYDTSWMEKWVEKDLQYGFARSFSTALLSILPLHKPMKVSLPVSDGDQVIVSVKDGQGLVAVLTWDSPDPTKAKLVALQVKKTK
ncbi:MAG: hypothetical protein LKE40_01355 [Spirochaetia bacterium]|jgi:hypothetical protein|nr:hypothetical protein [Spirochaetia bacterium]